MTDEILDQVLHLRSVMEDIAAGVDWLNVHVGKLIEDLSALNARFASAETRLERIDERLERIGTTLDD